MKLGATLVTIGFCLWLVPATAHGQTAQKRQAAASQQVHVDELPQAVTAAVKKSYPNGSIVTAYKMTRGTDTRFELWVKPTADAQAVVVSATPDGQLLAGRGQGKQTRKAPLPAAGAKAAAKTASPSSSAQGDPIAVDQLPKAVTKSIKDAYPKNTIIQAFKIASGADVTYHVVLDDVASVQPMRVFVTADGKILKR